MIRGMTYSLEELPTLVVENPAAPSPSFQFREVEPLEDPRIWE